jgi:ABC-type molybdate transport system permease subunit
MDSASQPDTPPGEPPSIFFNLLGIVIAVLTLTLPMAVVSHFSSAQGIPQQPTTLSPPRPER